MKKLIILLVIICTLTACGKKGSDTKWQEQYNLGMRYLQEENYEEAMVDFQKAIQLEPNQASAYLGLAEIYLNQDNFEDALAILQEGLEKTDENAELKNKFEEIQRKALEKFQKTARQLEMNQLEKLKTAYGLIGTEDSSPADQGISNAVFCDTDGDGISELLLVSKNENADVYAELYTVVDGELTQCFKEKIAGIDYCDALTVRIFFSDELSSYCIASEQESVWAYTGANLLRSAIYRISENNLIQARAWEMDDVDPGYQDAWTSDNFATIASEMQRLGMTYSAVSWIQASMPENNSMEEQLLFQNTVDAQGMDAMERTYDLHFRSHEELNASDFFEISEEQKQRLKEKNSVSETELKASMRDALLATQCLLAGCNGVPLDADDQITGPAYPDVDDFYGAAIGYHSLEEVKTYIHSIVSDEIYAHYFDEEKYIEQDGKVYFKLGLYGGEMDMNSFEIDSLEDNTCKITMDEYLGEEIYLDTYSITLTKQENRWVVQEINSKGQDKGYGLVPDTEHADFLACYVINE